MAATIYRASRYISAQIMISNCQGALLVSSVSKPLSISVWQLARSSEKAE
jgi:hypothetical protein